MIPLYGLIVVGYVSGRYLEIKKDTIATLLLYVFGPVVGFNSILTYRISLNVLSIPLLAYLICTIIALITLYAGNFIWKDDTKNMLSVGIANGNFGFLGLPLTLVLFGQKYFALTALFGIGASVFVATLGRFIAARANYNLRESMIKVAKLPLIYALLFGILLNLLKIPIHNSVHQVLNNMNGAFSVLGLMLVGIAMSELGKIKIDAVLIIFTIIMTFILWPLLASGFIFLDRSTLRLYTPDIYRILLLMSILPVGASIVPISTELKVQPEKASFAVLFTTLMSLIYIPIFIALFM
jgi:predicted permease